MNKTILIGIGILILAGGVLAFIFTRGGAAPAGTSATATSSPFGTPSDSDIPAAQPDFVGEVAPLPETTLVGGGVGLKLFKLESSPVAGFTILTQGSTTRIRFADRATGHIFDVKVPSLDKVRLTNNTLPQIYEAYFREDGGAALFRALDDTDTVKNMALTLTPPKATSASTSSPQATNALYGTSMTLLRGNIEGISTGKGDALSYVVTDSKAVVSSKFSGEAVKTLWSGPFTAWRTQKLGSGLLVFTKPSASLPGYAYRLVSGALTKVLGPLNGLVVTTNPAGTHMMYSYIQGNSTRLWAGEVGKTDSMEFLPSTIADKCAGSPQEKGVFYCGVVPGGIVGSEPDLWYQGKAHFSDEIWRFDPATQSANLLLEPEGGFGVSLDVSLPQISPDGKYLVFINKQDLSLWAVSLR